jgi:hypothetical protein
MLEQSNRKLTKEQMDFVMFKYGKCLQPLYLKLAFEQAKLWTSYAEKDRWQLGVSIEAAVNQVRE